MDDQSLADLAHECGLEYDDFHDYVDDSGVVFGQIPEEGKYEDIDDLIEQYENSSPSPPERRSASNGRISSSYNPLFARHAVPQASYGFDEITGYEEPRQNYEPHLQYPTTAHADDGPSSRCSPNSDRRSYAAQSTQFASRQTYQQPARPMPAHQQNASHPTIPRLLHSVNRSTPAAKQGHDDVQSVDRGSNPRNAHGIRLRPVSELPDVYRGMFKFGVFNAVQSKCFDKMMHTNENMVISAPTGSGKTVLFELAIIRMLMQAGGNHQASKCIYVAPTKALCSEKCRDWTTKFQALGINCCELTGDTVQFGKSAWGNARDASIIVTTGEKWDSLTRSWRDHDQILSQIQLFLVDEVHILNESRGSTLEVVLSRMKVRGSSVRFVVVSATVPNIEDVASWIGDSTPHGCATVMQFGEEYRPCKLTKVVYGIPRKRDQNDFVFQKTLDYRLYSILQQHSVNKPMLVFCSTRKGVMGSAEQILKEYEEASDKKQTLPWSRPPRIEQVFQNKRLEKLAACGIGIHHAGMSMDDRRATEDLYLKKLLRILFATSTLAVGVNLPAHTVIIKGVKIFQNNTSQEYSDLDIIQMMGRAGRPQFDKEGVAIIMCETELEAKYTALVQGRTFLESCLHRNLSEHINSEIGLGTITDLDTAKSWLHNSFLFRRIQKNPKHYAIGKENGQTWQERIDEMVTQSITGLRETELVTYAEDTDGQLSSTEYGDIMSKFYVRQRTMGLILKLSERASIREILEMISNAEEYADIKLRGGDKQIYNKMRMHNDIRFQVKKIDKPADKIFVLIQAVLGCISLSDPDYKSGDNNPHLEASSVFRHVVRIAKAIVEVAIVKKAGALLKCGLEIIRCLNARAWEDRYSVLRQVEYIGEKSIKVLAEYGITTLAALRKQDPLRIEALLNRRPPFGHEVIAAVQQLPQYRLSVTEVDVTTFGGKKPVEVELSIECGLAAESASRGKTKKVKNKFSDMTVVLTLTSDLDFIDFRRIPTKALRESKSFTITTELTKPSQSVEVYITSESIAGITLSDSWKPQLDAKHYPTLDTRPQSSMDLMLEGLDDDPDFWNMGPDDEDNPMKDNEDIEMCEPVHIERKIDPQKITGKPSKGHIKPDLEGSGRSILGFKLLPNGKYECNHTCKDKTRCRHMCCREGLEKPPPMTKKRAEAISADADLQSKLSKDIETKTARIAHVEDVVKLKPKQKQKSKAHDRLDARLSHLETLHEKTHVKDNLKLPTGQRIKLDDHGASVSKKPRADPPPVDLIDIDDSDDELPEPRDLLRAFSPPRPHQDNLSDRSETNYSNSEIDALILAVSSNDSSSAKGNVRQVRSNWAIPPPADPRWTTPSPSLKRTYETQDLSPKPKRIKTASRTMYRTPSPAHVSVVRLLSLGKGKEKPLFIPASSDEEDPPSVITDHKSHQGRHSFQEDPKQEEVVLDSSLFDILPDVNEDQPSTVSKVKKEEQETSYRQQSGTAKSVLGDVQTTKADGSSQSDANAEITQPVSIWQDAEEDSSSYQNDLAELEAWLQSGAVEIIE